jgi:hypothetical protein
MGRQNQLMILLANYLSGYINQDNDITSYLIASLQSYLSECGPHIWESRKLFKKWDESEELTIIVFIVPALGSEGILWLKVIRGWRVIYNNHILEVSPESR